MTIHVPYHARRRATMPLSMALGAALVAAAGSTARAQCLQQWDGDLGIPPGVNGIVYAMTTFDPDDAGPLGPQLVVAGAFGTAGGVAANKIARWDGVTWHPFDVGIGTNSAVNIVSLVVWDPDGSGPQTGQLIAGGHFGASAGAAAGNYIQRWDVPTQTWQPLGTGMNNNVRGLTVWDPDGSGPFPPQLIAVGDFTLAGGVTVNHVARWDGAAWHPLGVGSNGTIVAASTVTPPGGGPPLLVVGGTFNNIGGNTILRVATFDGTTWAPLGSGMNSTVWCFEHFNFGTSTQLVAGGDFTTAGGAAANRIARWDGAAWQPIGTGFNGTVYSLTTWDPDGTGSSPTNLVATGAFTTADGNPAPRVASWTGTAWQALGTSGVNGSNVYAATTFDPDGPGPVYPQLAVGGDFTLAAGAIANGLAAWVSYSAPVVLTSPSPAGTCPGGQAVFTVRAAAGAFPTYQWRHNGANLSDGPTGSGSSILGSHSIQLTISSATLADEGPYDVIVTNGCGNGMSAPAMLSMCYGNCDCSTAAPILNVNDFICFQSRFASGNPAANCDLSTTPPVLNVNDFICFQTKFAAGCP